MADEGNSTTLPPTCTEFVVAANPTGIMLVLGQPVLSVSKGPEGAVATKVGIAWHTQVFLPPAGAKSLAQSLAEAVAALEKESGEIVLPKKK